MPQAGPAQVARAISAARLAFDDRPWPQMSGEERSRLLFVFAECIEARRDELTAGVVYECGTPVTQSQIGPSTTLRSPARVPSGS